jgi:hypothetical protein
VTPASAWLGTIENVLATSAAHPQLDKNTAFIEVIGAYLSG